MLHEIPLEAPKQGLSDAKAYSEQPPMTTARSLNMRTQQDSTGRLRVSKRAGFSSYTVAADGSERPLLTNRLAFTEDFGHLRDTRAGNVPWPPSEGWVVQVTGAASVSVVEDGELAPDGVEAAQLVTQELATGAQRSELAQVFDVNDPPGSLAAKPGATFLRDSFAGVSLVFSVYIKPGPSAPTTSQLTIRQGNIIRTDVLITWASPTAPTVTPTGGGAHAGGVSADANGWYRVWGSIEWDAGQEGTAPSLSCILLPNQADATVKGVYLWGAQLELVPSTPTPIEPRRYTPQLGRNYPADAERVGAVLPVSHLQPTAAWRTTGDQLEPERAHFLPEKLGATHVTIGRDGSRYVLSAQAVHKYNEKGSLVFSISVPTVDPGHVCAALHVDEVDQVYVGVTEGGDVATAKLWCYRQGPAVSGSEIREDAYHLLWEVETEAFVTNITSREGVLYTTQDDPVTRRSWLVSYEALDEPREPLEGIRRTVPYPAAGLDVKEGGIVTCHPTNALRGLDPTADGSDRYGPWPPAVGWRPEVDFATYQEDVWCDLDSEFVNGKGRPTTEDFDEGEAVNTWFDKSGKSRNLYKPTGGGGTGGATVRAAPTVALNGMSHVPGVRFVAADEQALVSNPNPGLLTDPNTLDPDTDLHRTLFPSYDGAVWTAYIVFRPTYGASASAVLGQPALDQAGTKNRHMVLQCNRQQNVAFEAGAALGWVSWWAEDATNLGQHDLQPVGVDQLVNFCIAVLQWNGTSVTVRFNGEPVAGSPFTVTPVPGGREATVVGYYEELTHPAVNFFDGQMLKILVYKTVHGASDIQLHEGYLANRYGGQGRLAAGHPYRIAPSVSSILLPSAAPIPAGKANVNLLNHRSTVLVKYAPSAELQWVVTDYPGVGFDAAFDSNGDVISFGQYDPDEAGLFTGHPGGPLERGQKGWLRRVLDKGDSADTDAPVADWCQNMVRDVADSKSKELDDGAFWTITDVTVTPNTGATADPLGGSLAEHLLDGAAGGAGTITRTFADTLLRDGSLYTFSLYLKADTATSAQIRLFQAAGTGSTGLTFTYATQTVAVTSAGLAAHLHYWDVEEIGNGWFRLQVTLNYLTADAASGLTVEITPDTTGAQLASYGYGAVLERNPRASTFAYESGQEKHFEPADASTNYGRISLDEFDNVLVPGIFDSAPPLQTAFTARVYDSDLYLVRDLDVGRRSADTFQAGRAGAFDPEVPEYMPGPPGLIRNLAARTEDFSQTFWDILPAASVTVTANAGLAPDGTLTADQLADASAGSEGAIGHSFPARELDLGQPYTFSVYLRRLTANTSRIKVQHVGGPGTNTDVLITWNANSKLAPILSTAASTGPGLHSATVEPAANGFYRISATITYGGGTLAPSIRPDTAGTAAILAWGAQLELGPRPTTYQANPGRWAFQPAPAPEDPIGVADRAVVVGPSTDLEAAATEPLEAVQELLLAEPVATGLEARVERTVALVAGTLRVVPRYGQIQTPRGGSGVLDPAARYVSAAVAYQRVVATDGARWAIYEPHVDGMAREFVADRGEVPEGAQLVVSWRGRVMALRTRDDPHAWFASAIEDVRDWDYFTPPLISSKAVFSATSRAGLAPDLINSAVPYDDQRLVLGCDHALWYLPADPLSDRAEWMLLSDITGMAFGNHSWCKDPEGRLYFLGSRGGFYVLAGPGSRPERLSTETIERRLSAIDLDNHYVELWWNWRAEGISISVIPYGRPTVTVASFFWGRRWNEWREDSYADLSVQPTATTVVDGPAASDRLLLAAGGDLILRRWDETAKSDGAFAISSRELVGPYQQEGSRDARLAALQVNLSEDSDGCSFDVFASDTPDDPGVARSSGTLAAGRNPRKQVRAKGSFLWVEMANSTAGESFAFEKGSLYVADAGRASR